MLLKGNYIVMTHWQAIKMALIFGSLIFITLIGADILGSVLQEVLR